MAIGKPGFNMTKISPVYLFAAILAFSVSGCAEEETTEKDGRAVLVTGSTGGLGREAALELARGGDHVIISSSKLFRLRTGQDVQERVEFHNTGPGQAPGLVVMSLRGEKDIEIVALFNASPEAQWFTLETGEDREFDLHPVQEHSHDPVVRGAHYFDDSYTFYVPARTTAVFVACDDEEDDDD